jgi:hypothetical protein
MKDPENAEGERPAEAAPDIFALAKRLAEKYLRTDIIIATSAKDGREYHGRLLGIVESGGRHIAVQAISGSQVILHYARPDDVPGLEELTGRNLALRDENRRVRYVRDADLGRTRTSERGWSR